jgi:hypothetical protein
MAELSADPTQTAKPAVTLKKGALVRVNRDSYMGSVEASASDPRPPEYIFAGPGELLLVKGEYGQVRWRRPVPDVWLKLSQLEVFS